MKLREYLASCRELAQLTTQNGWIDDSTLVVKVLEPTPRGFTAEVRFEEIVMEGSGCVADRKPCFGIVQVRLNADGDVQGIDLL